MISPLVHKRDAISGNQSDEMTRDRHLEALPLELIQVVKNIESLVSGIKRNFYSNFMYCLSSTKG
jgi:hypothetical protein